MDYEKTTKGVGEMAYWNERKEAEGDLANSWYERFYTSHFRLKMEDYSDKRVLDIGCGPRGSLEWAEMALQRVGLDPLADQYLELGASEHAMEYVASGVEHIPFPDGHFDIVCSFNSIDHVDSLEEAIAEIKRVLKVGGTFLLLTDVHEEPTPQEPVCFDWSVIDLFSPEFIAQSIETYEKGERGMYASVADPTFFDHSDDTKRYGILSARFSRVEPPPMAQRRGILRWLGLRS
ncbi:MAG: class I SAM-dependent methyltransferase [Acidimicrobiia bacterium]